MEIILLISIFLYASLFFETMGIYFRSIGSFYGEPAQGYSTHVRIATLARFFVLLSAPMLGFMIDNNALPKDISLVGVFLFLFLFLSILYAINFVPKRLYYKTYNFLNGCKARVDPPESLGFSHFRISYRKVFYLSILSFSITAVGIIVVNLMASIFVDNRAMLVQMAAFITMAGTLIHVMMLDPILSKSSDQGFEQSNKVISDFILGRLFSSLLLFFIFTIIYLSL